MLEVRDLVKVYKPKTGVPVTALAGVSVKFPDTGMVFLLGKSGCGKSTFLNILGGLDRSTAGEILIMGKSSRTFHQSHFDSYRNTYVGFIFQEYNILEEFSVGANIALALQLQGIKPTSQQINAILREVDLEGYGNRKPAELSGGQKQRVAIARALVKNPKIIMADEPTGALDSGTGRQVLTTLKKLSREKLVIVVSHDREFAEQYADRIIEMADGRIFRDIQRDTTGDITMEAPVFDGSQVTLPEAYTLTEEDRKAICDYIQAMLSQGKAPQFSLAGQKNAGSFYPTDEKKIVNRQDGYRLIKSRLPMKYAFKLGASGLKHKKIRLVITIFLSCVAFVLFGLADTMASYSYVTTATKSLLDPSSHVDYATFTKELVPDEDGNYDYSYDQSLTIFRPEDIEEIEDRTGLEVRPVYNCTDLTNDLSFYSNLPSTFQENYSFYSLYQANLSGMMVLDEDLPEELGLELVCGQLPSEANHILISSHVARMFQEYGYIPYDGNSVATIRQPEDLLGKTLNFSAGYYGIGFPGWSDGSIVIGGDLGYEDGYDPRAAEYEICGVFDVNLDYDRYEPLSDPYDPEMGFVEQMALTVLHSELSYACNYGLAGIGIVTQEGLPENTGYYSQVIAPMPTEEEQVRAVAAFSAEVYETSDSRITFDLQNPICMELKGLDQAFVFLRKVFFWIGIFFVIFASLLFSNFISTSISYKKREIGILRAIGSRSNDVFRIFFAESFIIAMINFVLSLAGTVVICGIINYFTRHSIGLLLTLLNVGIRQFLLLFGVCIGVAFLASFLPVRRIASKRPIDAIKNL